MKFLKKLFQKKHSDVSFKTSDIVQSVDENDKNEYRDRIKKISEKQEKERRLYNVIQPFYNCLNILYNINSTYFTYQKEIDVLKEMLIEIESLPIDSYYEKGKKEAIKKIKKDFEDFYLNDDMNFLLNNSSEFLRNIENFHKKILINSIEPFYNYWKSAVKALKQKTAKTKRKQYVIDGLIELNKELSTLNPTQEELKKVDTLIKKIEEEDWKLL